MRRSPRGMGEATSLTRSGPSSQQLGGGAQSQQPPIWGPPPPRPGAGHSQATEPRSETEGVGCHGAESTLHDGAGRRSRVMGGPPLLGAPPLRPQRPPAPSVSPGPPIPLQAPRLPWTPESPELPGLLQSLRSRPPSPGSPGPARTPHRQSAPHRSRSSPRPRR